MRNRGEAPVGALKRSGEAGREQLELWRGSQPGLPKNRPTPRSSAGTNAALRLDPQQLSLEVSGAKRGGAVAGQGRAP